jgi:hypothetical protein
MKKSLSIAVVLGSMIACGCVGVDVQPTSAGQDLKLDLPAPSVTLSLNSLSDAVTSAGAPILIEVVVSAPDGRDAATPVTLSKPGGEWGGLLTIEVRGSTGGLVSGFTLRPLVTTEESIELNGETLGGMAWAIEIGAGTPLPAGEYSVVAVLDTTTTPGDGWKGKTSSSPSVLTVKSSELSADEARLVALARIRIHSYLGETDSALAGVDAFLVTHPKDGLMMEERADSLARAGRFAEAVVAYDAAIANVAPQEESLLREPPHLLIRKRDMAEEAAKADGAK